MNSRSTANAANGERTSWLPMAAIAMGQAPLLLALARQQHSVQGIAAPSYSGRIEKTETVPIEPRPAIVRPRSRLVHGAPVPFDVASHGESEHE